MAGHVARMEDGRYAFKILTDEPLGKRFLGTPRRMWEENNRIYLKEIGINTRNWVDLTQDRYFWRALVNAALNLRVSYAMELAPHIVWVNKSRRLSKMAGHVARMEEGRCAFKILTAKPKGKRPLGKPGHRWKDNIGINIEKIGINTRNWVDTVQDRDYWRALVNVALNFLVS